MTKLAVTLPITSATADNTGKATITAELSAAYYFVGTILADGGGGGTWTLAKQDGHRLAFALEDATVGGVALGPAVIAAGESIVITVTGLAAGASVTAEAVGFQCADATEAATVGVLPAPSQMQAITGSVTISAGTVNVGTITGTVNVAGNVGISGTPTVQFAAGSTVQISGTPTVQFAAGSAVQISGTPTVQFAPGQTVSVSAGSVNITGGQGGTNTNVSMDTPPRSLGSFQIPVGSATASGTFTGSAAATGILIFTSLPTPSAVGNLTLQVIGQTTNIDYTNGGINNQKSAAGSTQGIALLFGADMAREPAGFTITATNGTNIAGTPLTIYVYEILASGVTQVVTPYDQPLPITPGKFNAGKSLMPGGSAGPTTSDTSVANFVVSTVANRYVLDAYLQFQVTATSSLHGVSLYLKGRTSGLIQTLVYGVVRGGVALSDHITRDFSNRPIDLIAKGMQTGETVDVFVSPSAVGDTALAAGVTVVGQQT